MPTDSLTGLENKQSYMEYLDRCLEEKKKLYLTRVDIIHLKTINERFGHKGGDTVIETTAKRVRLHFKEARIFHTAPISFVVLEDTKSDPEELLERLSEAIDISGQKVQPKIRIFRMETKEDDTERQINTIFRYVSSKPGLLRERLIGIDETLRSEALQEDDLMKEILIGIEKESFMVWYQPVMDEESGKMISAEALSRLISSEGKFINPGKLFAYAEEKRLNRAITQIVLKKVCRFLGEHKDLDIGSISVNMTPDEILDETMPETLEKMCEEYGVPLSKIRLEMTERTIQRSPEKIIEIMEKMKEMGVGMYLDDFGTGYSNVTSLINMPFECIKLDKSLVDMIEDENKVKMIPLICEMIHIGKAKIIAEGVEEKSQEEFLKEHGVERIQGWIYSKPLPEDEFTEFAKGKGKGL